MAINAQTEPESNPPTYTFAPSGTQLDWGQFLRAWAAEVARQQPDAAGAWIFAALHAAADEAVVWGVQSPEAHTAQREATEAMDAAYLAELQRDAQWAWDHGPEPDPNDPASSGSLIGPDEEHCMRGWIAPNDDLIN